MDYIVFSADNSISHQNRNLSNPFTPGWTGEPAFLPLRLTQAGSGAGIFRKIDPIPDEEHVYRPDLAAVVPLARKMFVEEAEQLRCLKKPFGGRAGERRLDAVVIRLLPQPDPHRHGEAEFGPGGGRLGQMPLGRETQGVFGRAPSDAVLHRYPAGHRKHLPV